VRLWRILDWANINQRRRNEKDRWVKRYFYRFSYRRPDRRIVRSESSNKVGDFYEVSITDEDGRTVYGFIHASVVEVFGTEEEKVIKEEKKVKKPEPKFEVNPQRRSTASFSAGGGFSNLTGDSGEYWKPGFYLNGSFFYPVASSVSIGGCVAYHRWTPDEEKLTEPYSGYGIDWDISGSATSLEIVPSVRLTLAKANSFEFFTQAGAGLSMIKLDAKVEATYLWQHLEESIDKQENRPCLLFGGGAVLGKEGSIQFEISALYHIVFSKDDRTNYFSAGIGLIF